MNSSSRQPEPITGKGTVHRSTVIVAGVDEPVAVASFARPGMGVVQHGDKGSESYRPSSGASCRWPPAGMVYSTRQPHLPGSEPTVPPTCEQWQRGQGSPTRAFTLTVTCSCGQGRGLGPNGVHVTSDRARKRAARERAAATGEPYMVARRNLEAPPPATQPAEPERPYPLVVRLLHDFTHRFPGVPKHADAAQVRAEHDARHKSRAAAVKARHDARKRAAIARHHRRATAE
jgi:hypothetical protein